MTDEIEQHVNFEEEGAYLITDKEIAIIPMERFVELKDRLDLQAATYGMDLEVADVPDGILVSWSKSASTD